MPNDLIVSAHARTVVVTGASAGIGRAIAERFIAGGDRVVTLARGAMDLLGAGHVHLRADLGTWAGAAQAAAMVVAQVGRVDILVNNVGRSEWRSLPRCDEAFVAEMFALNVAGVVAMTQGVVRAMAAGGLVLNMSSMAAKRGTANNAIYCATKFALNGLTQAWAKEFGPQGIRVNALCPVLVRSPGLDAALVAPEAPAAESGIAAFLDGFIRSQAALGRLPTAADVAAAAWLLAAPEAAAVTGQCLNVDCGVFPQ